MEIIAHGVGVQVDGHDVLVDARAEVRSGSALALAGPSGSGKTTLLNVLGLLTRPDTGRLTVDGTDATRWSDRRRLAFWRSRAAFVFQDYGLIDEESVLYNVGIARLTAFGAARRARPTVAAALSSVGLAGREGDRVSTLSGGEKQRVGLARAMFRQAEVIFADEPTASLDRANRELVTGLLLAEARRGAAVVIATHDERLMSACDAKVDLIPRTN